jgi:hypothetical protein
MFYEQLLQVQISKKTVQSSVFFKVSGSAGAKAANKKLVKLTPASNFINILRTCFLYEILAPKNFNPKTQLCKNVRVKC